MYTACACTLYVVLYTGTLYTIHCALYKVQSKPYYNYIIRCTLYTAHGVRRTKYNVQRITNIFYDVYCTQYTLHRTLCAVYYVISGVQCIHLYIFTYVHLYTSCMAYTVRRIFTYICILIIYLTIFSIYIYIYFT